MKYSTFRFWKMIVTIILAALVAWATIQGNPWIPLPAAAAATVIILVARKGVKETTVDERTYSIANRASRIAYQIGALAMALTGATLMALGRGDYPELLDVSYVLLCAAGGLAAIYTVAFYIIAARMGGTTE